MLLSSKSISEYVKSGRIAVLPEYDDKQLRPFGLRVHLGKRVLRLKPGQEIDLRESEKEPELLEEDIRERGIRLSPGEFVLAATAESFRVDSKICCRLDGRSTIARLGIGIHCTASTIDGNHTDYRAIVLELTNSGPCAVTIPFMYAIGMVAFEEAEKDTDVELEQSQYSGQRSVAGPNLSFAPEPYNPVENMEKQSKRTAKRMEQETSLF
jgi:dCTP deaminase